MPSKSETQRSVTALAPVASDLGTAIEGKSTSLLAGVGRAFVVRVATLPVAAIAGLLAARVTVSTLGVDGYAIFALVVGLAALNPVGDLGVGAAVTDAVARRHELGVEMVQRVLRTSLRVLVVVSLVLTITAWALAPLGFWATILGVLPSREVDVAVATTVTIFAVGHVMNQGQAPVRSDSPTGPGFSR